MTPLHFFKPVSQQFLPPLRRVARVLSVALVLCSGIGFSDEGSAKPAAPSLKPLNTQALGPALVAATFSPLEKSSQSDRQLLVHLYEQEATPKQLLRTPLRARVVLTALSLLVASLSNLSLAQTLFEPPQTTLLTPVPLDKGSLWMQHLLSLLETVHRTPTSAEGVKQALADKDPNVQFMGVQAAPDLDRAIGDALLVDVLSGPQYPSQVRQSAARLLQLHHRLPWALLRAAYDRGDLETKFWIGYLLRQCDVRGPLWDLIQKDPSLGVYFNEGQPSVGRSTGPGPLQAWSWASSENPALRLRFLEVLSGASEPWWARFALASRVGELPGIKDAPNLALLARQLLRSNDSQDRSIGVSLAIALERTDLRRLASERVMDTQEDPWLRYATAYLGVRELHAATPAALEEASAQTDAFGRAMIEENRIEFTDWKAVRSQIRREITMPKRPAGTPDAIDRSLEWLVQKEQKGRLESAMGTLLFNSLGHAANHADEAQTFVDALRPRLEALQPQWTQDLFPLYERARRLHISLPYRFGATHLKKIVEMREHKDPPALYSVLVVYPVADHNGAFWDVGVVVTLLDRHYHVDFYELGKREDWSYIVKTQEDHPDDDLVVAAHGSRDTLSIGEEHARLSKPKSLSLQLSDEKWLKRQNLASLIKKNGGMGIMDSCETGLGENNIANMFMRLFPGLSRMIAPTHAVLAPKLEFSGDRLRGGTYLDGAPVETPSGAENFVYSALRGHVPPRSGSRRKIHAIFRHMQTLHAAA